MSSQRERALERAEYTPMPSKTAQAPRPELNWPLAAVAAGAACAAVFIGLFEAPRAKAPASKAPPPADIEPRGVVLSAPPAIERPSPRSLPIPPAESSRRGVERVERAQPARRPAWAAAALVQEWLWPARLERLGTAGHLAPAATRRVLASWNPSAPEGERAVFSVRSADGSERLVSEAQERAAPRAPDWSSLRRPGIRVADWSKAPPVKDTTGRGMDLSGPRGLNDDQLQRVRAQERQDLAKQLGAVEVKDVTKAGSPALALLTFGDGHTEVVPYDPLVFDLSGRGAQTSPRKALFDLVAERRDDRIQWVNDVAEGTGILVFDSDKSGRAGKSGAEVFGDRTDLEDAGRPDGFANGFEALRGLVLRAVAEGVLRRDAVASGVLDAAALEALGKAYGLGMKLGGFNGRSVSLADAGVNAIALSGEPPQRLRDFDGRGNDLVAQPGAVFLRADGTTGSYMNLFLGASREAPELAQEPR